MASTLSTQSLALKSKLFRGFADPSRLAVLEALRDGPRRVSELVELTGLSQSNTSNHLSCLHDCDLVKRKQQGRSVYYELSDPRVLTFLQLGDELLADVARGMYECTRYQVPDTDHVEPAA